MEQFEHSPFGETGPSRHQSGSGLSAGSRKATLASVKTAKLAEAGSQMNIEKGKAQIAVKRVANAIGLKAGDLLLLDTLFAFSQPQDWAYGRQAIVWASNDRLREQTGFSRSALRRHVRRLIEIGVISPKDSPNGKRWGRRNMDGFIIEAYGFDLSPLAARAVEFEALHAEIREERELCKSLKRRITTKRRSIRAQLEAASFNRWVGPWAAFAEALEALLSKLPKGSTTSEILMTLEKQFSLLLAKVSAALIRANQPESTVDNIPDTGVEAVQETSKMDPSGAGNGPHIPTTKKLKIESCNCNEKQTRKEQVNSAGLKQSKSDQENAQKRGINIELGTIMQACPGFTKFVRETNSFVKDWNDLYRTANEMNGWIGLSKVTWQYAQKCLGPQIAAATFALIFDKHQAGEVKNPEGYLRGIIRKAERETFHVERSLYGRLKKQVA